MADTRRIDLGFQGGQVLAIRAPAESQEKLEKALADDGGSRWHTLETTDEHILVDLSQVVYVRRESGTQKVGF
jgi:hypothetical protein